MPITNIDSVLDAEDARLKSRLTSSATDIEKIGVRKALRVLFGLRKRVTETEAHYGVRLATLIPKVDTELWSDTFLSDLAAAVEKDLGRLVPVVGGSTTSLVKDWEPGVPVRQNELRRATADVGDIKIGDVVRSNSARTTGPVFDATEAAEWTEVSTDPVQSVAGKTGHVAIEIADIGAGAGVSYADDFSTDTIAGGQWVDLSDPGGSVQIEQIARPDPEPSLSVAHFTGAVSGSNQGGTIASTSASFESVVPITFEAVMGVNTSRANSKAMMGIIGPTGNPVAIAGMQVQADGSVVSFYLDQAGSLVTGAALGQSLSLGGYFGQRMRVAVDAGGAVTYEWLTSSMSASGPTVAADTYKVALRGEAGDDLTVDSIADEMSATGGAGSALQAALDSKEDKASKGTPGGYAPLDAGGQLSAAYAPDKSVYSAGGAQGLTPADIGAKPDFSVLPIAEGGTGGTDASSARAGLEIKAGQATVDGSGTWQPVAFATAYPVGVVPRVIATAAGQSFFCAVRSQSNTGFEFLPVDADGTVHTGLDLVDWIAIPGTD